MEAAQKRDDYDCESLRQRNPNSPSGNGNAVTETPKSNLLDASTKVHRHHRYGGCGGRGCCCQFQALKARCYELYCDKTKDDANDTEPNPFLDAMVCHQVSKKGWDRIFFKDSNVVCAVVVFICVVAGLGITFVAGPRRRDEDEDEDVQDEDVKDEDVQDEDVQDEDVKDDDTPHSPLWLRICLFALAVVIDVALLLFCCASDHDRKRNVHAMRRTMATTRDIMATTTRDLNSMATTRDLKSMATKTDVMDMMATKEDFKVMIMKMDVAVKQGRLGSMTLLPNPTQAQKAAMITLQQQIDQELAAIAELEQKVDQL